MSSPRAWVVQCNECGCIVTARAEDPQAHMQDPEPRPTCRLLVTCSCCWTSWLYPPEALFNGSPAPSPECFKRARQSARTENAKLIAAAVIAAIRLNRDEIKNSPVVHAKINTICSAQSTEGLVVRVLLDNGIFSHAEFAVGAVIESEFQWGNTSQEIPVHGLVRKTPSENDELEKQKEALFTVGRLIREGRIEPYDYNEISYERMRDYMSYQSAESLLNQAILCWPYL